jgi:hypothetical protein
VRKSFAIALVGAVVIALVGVAVAFWLPARRASQDRTWLAAGQVALANLRVPATFRNFDDAGARIEICETTPTQRCFAASGNPQQDLAAAQAALAGVASGPMQSFCQVSPLPHSPQSCRIRLTVAGSKLVADLFPRAIPHRGTTPHFTFSGTYMNVHIPGR